jgi:very-short-patch-repair endonuclease
MEVNHPNSSPLAGEGRVRGHKVDVLKNQQTQLARSLRRRQTDAERKLWWQLRNGQLNGVKFRRQQPVGNYFVDFISFEKNLVIEVDGGQHNEPAAARHDEDRTKYLESRGYGVIRFWNNDILQNLEGVIDRILEELGGT